jgi:hypothetical protein
MTEQRLAGTDDIVPEFPDVQVYLADVADDDLELIYKVTQALADGGHLLAARAFAQVACTTETMADLMLLVRVTVSVI